MIKLKELLFEQRSQLVEWSKNDPIPELTSGNDKLAIFLLGAPLAGKTTFIKNFILPKKEMKIFNSDIFSYLYTKDENKRHKNTSELNRKYIEQFVNKSNDSFVYDGTGIYPDFMFSAIELAKKQGYKIIIIYLFVPLKKSLEQNKLRKRFVDENYIIYSFNLIRPLIKKYYSELKPDKLYIVLNSNQKYKIMNYNK